LCRPQFRFARKPPMPQSIHMFFLIPFSEF